MAVTHQFVSAIADDADTTLVRPSNWNAAHTITLTKAEFDTACSDGDFVFISGDAGTPSALVGTNISGTAAGLTAGNVTTNANLTGDVTSVGNAATVVKINGTSLAGLATGILKNTTTTGVPSIAVAGDFPTLNQNTTGNATTATTSTHLAGGSGGTIPYQSAAGTTAMLANGTAGQVLQSNGTTLAPSWVAAGAGDMILASIQTVTGAKTFGGAGAVGKFILAGNTSGTTILDATAVAGAGTVTLPTTGTLATLAGVETLTNKSISGGQITSAVANATLAATVTNATLTTAVTVNTGTVTLTGNVANTSVLTIGAGAVSVSGANTGDNPGVTAVSVATANGVSGSSSGGATPALTIALGSITPSAVQVSGLTASEITGTDASKNIVSLAVATYPSLTELTYVKGVTSAIQTQINTKGVGSVTSVTSANADATVATTTTTPVITIVQAPALRSATTTVSVSAATAPTSGQVLTATASTTATWQTPSGGGFDPTTTVEIMEEFIGGVNTTGQMFTHGWRFSGLGSIVGVQGISGKPGIARIGSGIVAAAGTTVELRNIENNNLFTGDLGNLTAIYSAANTQAAHADATLRIGLSGQGSSAGDGEQLLLFRATGTGNWFAVTKATGAETATDTGVAQSTSYKQFKTITNSAGTSIGFYIDGVLKATHTTNLPTGNLVPKVQIQTASTTAYSIDIDYFYVKVTGLSR